MRATLTIFSCWRAGKQAAIERQKDKFACGLLPTSLGKTTADGILIEHFGAAAVSDGLKMTTGQYREFSDFRFQVLKLPARNAENITACRRRE